MCEMYTHTQLVKGGSHNRPSSLFPHPAGNDLDIAQGFYLLCVFTRMELVFYFAWSILSQHTEPLLGRESLL